MNFTNFDRFLVIVIIMLLTVIVIQNGQTSIKPAFAYQNNEEAPSFPIKISNIDEIAGGGSVSGFSTDDQGRFVVIDGVNHKMMFCEVIWNGPSASLMVRDTKEF